MKFSGCEKKAASGLGIIGRQQPLRPGSNGGETSKGWNIDLCAKRNDECSITGRRIAVKTKN